MPQAFGMSWGLGFGFWLRVWGLRILRISAFLGPLDSDSVVLGCRGFSKAWGHVQQDFGADP